MDTFYGSLAPWWPVLSPVEDYAEEGREIARVMRARRPGARTLLELGCGGGHLAHHVRPGFEYVLSDLSPQMLAVALATNPGCEGVVGDLRTLRLDRRFDLVLVHDAVDYLLTEDDLRAAFATARHHLHPGGLALFVPDDFVDTFEPGESVSGSDHPDGRSARMLEWTEDVGPDGTVPVHYSFVLRDADGTVHTAYERHRCGLFEEATWSRLLAEAGFEVEVVTERTEEERPPRRFFLGHLRSA